MEPTPELIDAIYRDKIRRSREMTIQQRVKVVQNCQTSAGK